MPGFHANVKGTVAISEISKNRPRLSILIMVNLKVSRSMVKGRSSSSKVEISSKVNGEMMSQAMACSGIRVKNHGRSVLSKTFSCTETSAPSTMLKSSTWGPSSMVFCRREGWGQKPILMGSIMKEICVTIQMAL
jgi:hypothetical protein